jgi:hypothetical protein
MNEKNGKAENTRTKKEEEEENKTVVVKTTDRTER